MQKGLSSLLIILLTALSLLIVFGYILFPYGLDLLKDNFLNVLVSQNYSKIAWQYPVKGNFGDFVVHQNMIYLTTNEGILYALDQVSGKVIWSYKYGEQLDSNTSGGSSIRIDNKTIFITGTFYNPYFNNYIAVDAETGQEKWIKKFENTIDPITAKENISIIMERVDWSNQYLKAFDNTSGNEIWSYPIGSQNYFHLSIHEGVVYFFHAKSYPDDIALEAIDLHTGKVKWAYQLNGRDEAFNPFKVGDLVIFGDAKDNDRSIKALAASTGTLQWISKSSILFNEPQLWNGSLIFKRTVSDKTESNFVVAIDAITGSDKWVFPIAKSGNSDLIVNQGKAYFSDNRYFYSVDADSGKQIWKNAATGNADPAPILISGNLLFYRDWKTISFPDSSANFIHALDVKSGRKVWSWKEPAYQIEKGDNNLVYFESKNTIYALEH